MKYLQRKKQEKLYRQWTQHSELPPEAVPRFDEPAQEVAGAGVPEETEGAEYIEPVESGHYYRPERAAGLEVGRNGRYILEDRGLWYRFRELLVDMVRKILRVD